MKVMGKWQERQGVESEGGWIIGERRREKSGLLEGRWEYYLQSEIVDGKVVVRGGVGGCGANGGWKVGGGKKKFLRGEFWIPFYRCRDRQTGTSSEEEKL